MSSGVHGRAIAAAAVAGPLAGAVVAGDIDDARGPMLCVGGLGLVVAAVCLLGLRVGLPRSAVVLSSALAASAASVVLALAVVGGDSETAASLLSSAVLDAL